METGDIELIKFQFSSKGPIVKVLRLELMIVWEKVVGSETFRIFSLGGHG